MEKQENAVWRAAGRVGKILTEPGEGEKWLGLGLLGGRTWQQTRGLPNKPRTPTQDQRERNLREFRSDETPNKDGRESHENRRHSDCEDQNQGLPPFTTDALEKAHRISSLFWIWYVHREGQHESVQSLCFRCCDVARQHQPRDDVLAEGKRVRNQFLSGYRI